MLRKKNSDYSLLLNDGDVCCAPVVLNATYFGINDVNKQVGQDVFDLKYELCEVVFCNVPHNFKNKGITVMDGDYFSILPFGDSGMHSFTSVRYMPHCVTYITPDDFLKTGGGKGICKMHGVDECVICAKNLRSSWKEMFNLGKTYLHPRFAPENIDYLYSKFAIKPILIASEGDDSRPTIIRQYTTAPTFISVLSGKVSTIYDLEKYL